MKPFFSDYVQHCMRFYVRYPNLKKFKSDTDRQNWNACRIVLLGFGNADTEILLDIYRDGDTIPDNIYKAAMRTRMPQEYIWKIVKKLERRVARERKLI